MNARGKDKKPRAIRRGAISYIDAVMWIAGNDDTEFLDDPPDEMHPSVTVCFLADIYQRDVMEVVADLRKAVLRLKS